MDGKILVIDDEIEICTLLMDFLKLQGFSVDYATSAHEGLEKFREQHPQLVLLDVRMPKMNGVEAIKEIRKIDRECGIIMVTAVVDKDITDKAVEMGVTDYIIKPFDLEYLRKSVISKFAALK